ncbi:nitrate- and nitrite sensing domain-containing protein [Streptomyces sp. AV19]|uniref:sensor histidine kinase n=1 Tax=Streptomyces sp. AV19 TaxID=2793068 RepID=UPI0024139352|nr:nitrate- and nitrite sensing domain-containing protein [Streptomyces sp. AV19]MDG4535833.1 nitrate- and nitrite sensing domain-containing protein [Streptomyces sp. AV19]
MPERTARARNRLATSVVLASLAVLGAGALGIADASRDAGDSGRLVPLAGAADDAVRLAHTLADERDATTAYVAGGRGGVPAALTAQRAAVDRKLGAFLTARSSRAALPAAVRERLEELTRQRRTALTGDADALTVFRQYTATVQALHGVAGTLAARLPARAGTGDAEAVALLGRAVEEASATRGLLLAALAARGGRPELAAAAQQTDTRERAALADFAQLAPAKAKDAYARAAQSHDSVAAESRLTALLTGPQPPSAAPADAEELRTALTARLARMRGVESDLAAAEAGHLERVRDRDVTALRTRAGLVGACFLVALLAGVRSTRSVTRPLAALRLGARRVCADPAAREPVSVKGCDDEFAEIARSVNVLHGTVVRQRERIDLLEGERARLDGARQDLAVERDALRERDRQRDAEAARTAGRAHSTCASLSLRTLGLVERQLTVIEAMEAHEADPDRLDVLFKLDHLATRMRRHSENLLVLAGSEHAGGHAGAVPLLDVLRASVSEIDRYERVRIQSLPARAQLAGFASDDISHLVAELLENATAFSPPDVPVQVSGWLLENGDVMLSIQDEGIGMAPDRLEEINSLLAQGDPEPPGARVPGHADDAVMGLGLYVVARLAARHAVRVQLREQRPGGITAVVVLPARLLPAAPPAVTDPQAAPPVPGTSTAPPVHFPGAAAEANSHQLPGRSRRMAGFAPQPVASGPPDEATIQLIVPPGVRSVVPEQRPAAPGPHPGPQAAVGRHARPPAPEPPPSHAGAMTGNGLPKRTPRTVPQPPPVQRMRRGVDAEALRAKLAGFQQGAREGRRDVAQELAGQRESDQRRAGTPNDGGDVEEARG